MRHAQLGFRAANSAFEADYWSPEWDIQRHCRVARRSLVWDTSAVEGPSNNILLAQLSIPDYNAWDGRATKSSQNVCGQCERLSV